MQEASRVLLFRADADAPVTLRMWIQAGARQALLTYCTNVHAADDLDALERALEDVTANVARTVAPDAPFGLGLRLNEEQADALTMDPSRLASFEALLARHRFFVFTVNAFPQGRFHARRVKDAVYRPHWADPARRRYTMTVARLLARWLPEGDRFGTISTLPLGWRGDVASLEDAIAREVWDFVIWLGRLEQETGARIMACFEPEPGCAVETIPELVLFFERMLSGPRRAELVGDRGEALLRRHAGACWDCCHQAVLFADPAQDLATLQAAGIEVGKVQISSALKLPVASAAGLSPLIACDEERFLHQVAVRSRRGGPDLRYDDLPDLAAAARGDSIFGPAEARCHFHVPIYAEAFPPLETTRGDMLASLDALLHASGVRHFEVETYTFHVLPEGLRGAHLGDHLVREIQSAQAALHGNRGIPGRG